MESRIDPTKPIDGQPAVKGDLRNSLAAAKAEIEALGVHVIDPEMFRGARGSSPAEDTATLQEALDDARATGGGSILLSRNYVLDTEIEVWDGTTIYGGGHRITITGRSSPLDCLRVGGKRVRLSGIELLSDSTVYGPVWCDVAEDLTVDHCRFLSPATPTDPNFSYSCIHITNRHTYRIRVTDNFFKNVGVGLVYNDLYGSSYDCHDVWFLRNVAHDCWNSPLLLNNPLQLGATPVGTGIRRSWCNDNVAIRHGQQDHTVHQVGHVFIYAGAKEAFCCRNIVDTYNGEAIHFEDESEKVVIEGNMIRNATDGATGYATTSPIFMIGTRDATVRGNIIDGHNNDDKTAAISFPYALVGPGLNIDARIVDNEIRNWPHGDGIEAAGILGHVEIRNNLIDGCKKGIADLGQGDRVIAGNVVKNASVAGLTRATFGNPGAERVEGNDLCWGSDGRVASTIPAGWVETNPRVHRVGVQDWQDIFDLGGTHASGTLYVAVSLAATAPLATARRAVPISWDGATLTVGTDLYSVTSGLSAIAIQMQGTVLQARVPDLGDDLVISASLDGTIYVTSTA